MPDIVVMFFMLGVVAGLLRSDLSIPKAAYDILSLLLMLTIGLKGGMAVYGNLHWTLLINLAVIACVGGLIPFVLRPILQRVIGLNGANASSIAAHYGSVSAGTFAVALAYVESHQLIADATVTLYLVMLELPAIIVAIALYKGANKTGESNSKLWHETLTNRGIVLLTGGLIIGFLYGPREGSAVTDLFIHSFQAILAIFLLEMGLTAADTLRPFPTDKWRAALFAVIAPCILGLAGLSLAAGLGMSLGTGVILAAMIASASYIAAPAAIRVAIPSADIGLAMLMSLGITFPFNVIFGIPLYHALASQTGLF